MSTLAQLEEAVRQLSDTDRVAFRAWYAEYDAEEWDRQLEADAEAGKLDWLIEEARRDNREGVARPDNPPVHVALENA